MEGSEFVVKKKISVKCAGPVNSMVLTSPCICRLISILFAISDSLPLPCSLKYNVTLLFYLLWWVIQKRFYINNYLQAYTLHHSVTEVLKYKRFPRASWLLPAKSHSTFPGSPSPQTYCSPFQAVNTQLHKACLYALFVPVLQQKVSLYT